jgi:hypothetical protein
MAPRRRQIDVNSVELDMYSNRILSVAALVALVACSDLPTYAPASLGPLDPQSAAVDMAGSVVVNRQDENVAIFLSTGGRELIPLIGDEAVRLAGLDGAEITVHGTWSSGISDTFDDPGRDPQSSTSAFLVDRFLVVEVNGHAALDGTLVTVEGAYALQLSDGSYHRLADPPAEMIAHVGERLWVTGGEQDLPLEFGVIQ